MLLETDDASNEWASERVLRRTGYEVAVCEGPDIHGSPCPLVATGECELAAGADVIINSFRLSQPHNRDVIRALRRELPGTPVVVEVGVQHVQRHGDLLAGCRVQSPPKTTQRFLRSVNDALERPPSTT